MVSCQLVFGLWPLVFGFGFLDLRICAKVDPLTKIKQSRDQGLRLKDRRPKTEDQRPKTEDQLTTDPFLFHYRNFCLGCGRAFVTEPGNGFLHHVQLNDVLAGLLRGGDQKRHLAFFAGL